jgi:tRNA modification GTPase
MFGDTIAAISTPPGEGGIGIVRLSGSDAVRFAESVFQSADGRSLREVPSHTIHYGHISLHGRTLDEVLVSVMRSPRTYTREDVVEINCHGGIVATRAVLDAVLTAGARLAERGEFTQRAFVNGRISLDQAQAVLDIVQAQTQLGLETAVERLEGRFSGVLEQLREELSSLLADVEVEIDFPDLDVSIDRLIERIRALRDHVADLVERSEGGRVVREGLTAAIIGRPNVGKSTLLNALLSEERSIVTAIPGTTRDTIEEVASIGGIPVRLIDTAGLRAPSDPVEAEGVRRSETAARRADVILLVLDSTEPLGPEDEALLETEWGPPVIVLLNKIDLPGQIPDPVTLSERPLEISAREGTHLDRLRERIVGLFFAGGIPSRQSVLLLDSWERDLLRRLLAALVSASDRAGEGSTPDIVAEELRAAYRAAADLQGIDAGEAVLSAIFSRFCVGK